MKTYTFTAGQIEGLAELLESESFDYQKTWLRVGQLNVDRTITKARQIGATQTFAYEGLLDALTSDGVWRQSVTLAQAIEQGHNLTDIEQLRREFSPADFKLLFECDWSQAVNAYEVSA